MVKKEQKVAKVVETASETPVEKTIEDLPGVGPATAQKLKDAGFSDLMIVALASPQMLISECEDLGVSSAQKIISAAREFADLGRFETGDVLLERRKGVSKLTTSSKNFDDLLGGGFETQAIIEMFGEYGSGKTQVVQQLDQRQRLFQVCR